MRRCDTLVRTNAAAVGRPAAATMKAHNEGSVAYAAFAPGPAHGYSLAGTCAAVPAGATSDVPNALLGFPGSLKEHVTDRGTRALGFLC